VIFCFFATAPQLDLFTQWVNKSARQKNNITLEFIEDLPMSAIITAESRFTWISRPTAAGST
jgi:hypothetical protein